MSWTDLLRKGASEGLGMLQSMLPATKLTSPTYQQELRKSVADTVGPPVELWTGKKPLGEKLLRTGAAVAENVAPVSAALMGYSGPAEASIRKGGDPTLTAIHKTSLQGLIAALKSDKGLFAPSYAITRGDTLGDKFGDATLLLRGSAIDPEKRVGTLFNQDAYTPRIPYNFKYMSDEDKADYIAQLRAQMQFPDAGRFGESADPSGGFPHYASIDESPNFKSFKQFEEDPHGATLISDSWGDIDNGRKATTKRIADWQSATLHEPEYGDELIGNSELMALMRDAASGEFKLKHQNLRELSTKGMQASMELASEALRAARRQPTQYAEGKILGHLPLDREAMHGVLLPRSKASPGGQDLLDMHTRHALETADLPVTDLGDYVTPDMVEMSEASTEAIARRLGDFRESTGAKWSQINTLARMYPDIIDPEIAKSSAWETLIPVAQKLPELITRHPKIASSNPAFQQELVQRATFEE